MDSIPSERIVVRDFLITDIDSTYISWLNDKVVTRYSRQRFTRHDYKSCREYFSAFSCSNNSFLAVLAKESGRKIGTLTVYRDLGKCTADIGIMIGDRRYWGSGYGSEAWASVIEEVSKDSRIMRVTGGCVKQNIAMAKIMEKSGMIFDYISQSEYTVNGKTETLVHYKKII